MEEEKKKILGCLQLKKRKRDPQEEEKKSRVKPSNLVEANSICMLILLHKTFYVGF